MKVRLVRNQKSVSEEVIQSLVCNLVPKQARLETLEDRLYTVVPMVILTEGVHSGSEGPMLYPKEELAKTPAAWDHKPIVVYHPEMNGVGISACKPEVINNRKVGLMMNTRWEKGKLKSEAWILMERAREVDERVVAAIENNEMMELSTGVFVDLEKEEGDWKGESYVGIARNYRPDHLALLPDKVGACSIADGAGFLRNQNAEWVSKVRRVLDAAGLLDNEMSHDNIRSSLADALRAKFGKTGAMEGPGLWVENVYSNFVIFEKDGKLFRLGYTSGDTGVTLADEQPVEVKRVTEYRTVEGAFVGNRNQGKDEAMNKKKLVDAIVSNAASAFKEEDREKLMALSEGQLEAIQKSLTPPETPKTEAASAPVANAAAPAAAPAKTEDPKPVTLESYVSQAPREIQEVLTNGLEIYNEEKNKLVEVILANKRNAFSKEELSGRPLGELRRIARLAEVEVPTTATRSVNYAGQAPVPTVNDAKEEAMGLPVMNFSK